MIKSKRPVLFILPFILFCLTGCNTKPPGKVNVCLSSPYEFYVIKFVSQPDTRIIAQCRQIKQYDKKTKGNWSTYWYLIDWKVIKVESGKWSDPNLTYVIADNWPTPESGIMVNKMPWPYRQGRIFCFGLDTSRKLPLIVHQEECSSIAPYGLIQKPKELKEEISKRIFVLVNNFLRNQKSDLTGSRIAEELDKFFVVECFGPDGSAKAVTVDKDSYKVSWIPESFDEK
jgi:hypothetical protein